MTGATDRRLLLDTHVWVWLALGIDGALQADTRSVLTAADRDSPLLVSFISTWEVAMLAAKERLNLTMPSRTWMLHALSHPAIKMLALDDPNVAAESNELPGNFHADPADRLLVATARLGGYTLVTRDRKILDYGRAGHVRVLPA